MATGNIFGVSLGLKYIPKRSVDQLDLVKVIDQFHSLIVGESDNR